MKIDSMTQAWNPSSLLMLHSHWSSSYQFGIPLSPYAFVGFACKSSSFVVKLSSHFAAMRDSLGFVSRISGQIVYSWIRRASLLLYHCLRSLFVGWPLALSRCSCAVDSDRNGCGEVYANSLCHRLDCSGQAVKVWVADQGKSCASSLQALRAGSLQTLVSESQGQRFRNACLLSHLID